MFNMLLNMFLTVIKQNPFCHKGVLLSNLAKNLVAQRFYVLGIPAGPKFFPSLIRPFKTAICSPR